MSSAPTRSSFLYKLAVSIALVTVFACGYLDRNGDTSLPEACFSYGESFVNTYSPPIQQQNQLPIPTDSQAPSEEFEEDDDDSNREILISTSLNGATDNLVVIARSTYYPPIQLDITTPPPRG